MVKKLPMGTEIRGGIKLAVKFKPEVFKQLRDRAARENKYFSDVLNDVLECGLLDLSELERDEELERVHA